MTCFRCGRRVYTVRDHITGATFLVAHDGTRWCKP